MLAKQYNHQDRNDSLQLSAVAVKACISISKKWQLTNETMARLLGMSKSSFERLKNNLTPSLTQDQLTRASLLVGIFSALNRLFANDMADKFINLPNDNSLFNGNSPLNAMVNGGIPQMLQIRAFFESLAE